MRRGPMALLALIVFAAHAPAQEKAHVEIAVEPETVMVGEPFTATVIFELSPDHEAIIPGEDADLGDAEVRSVKQSVAATDDGGKRYTVEYAAVLWEVGEGTVSSPAIASRGRGGEVTALESAEVTITVESVLPEGAEDIQGIRGPREIPLRWHHYALAALPVLALLGLAALLVRWLLSRRRGEEREQTGAPQLPPAEEALDALAQLESDDLPGQGLVKEHYVRLSWILRNYAERRWSVPALEETTGMLRHTMLGSGRIPGTMVEQATAVLRRADLAKFAKHRPEPSTAREDITEVREIVRASRPRQEVTEDGAPDEAPPSPAG